MCVLLFFGGGCLFVVVVVLFLFWVVFGDCYLNKNIYIYIVLNHIISNVLFGRFFSR